MATSLELPSVAGSKSRLTLTIASDLPLDQARRMIRPNRPRGNGMSPKDVEGWLGLLNLAFRSPNAFYSMLLLASALDITLAISGYSILDLRWSNLSDAVALGVAIPVVVAVSLLILHSSWVVRRFLAGKEFLLSRIEDFFRWALETPDRPSQPPCCETVSLRDAERHAITTADDKLAERVIAARSILLANQETALMGARLSLVCLILIGIDLLFPNGTFAASGDYRTAIWGGLAFLAARPLLELQRRRIEGDGRVECPDLAWTLTLAWYASRGREPPGHAYRAGTMRAIGK